MNLRFVLIWMSLVLIAVVAAWGLLGTRVGVRSAAGPESGMGTSASALPSFDATDRDWEIVQQTVQQARARGLATQPIGDIIAEVGLSFVGTPYEPGTLELPGEERLAVNLRALDCVTFVENALVLAALVKWVDDEIVADRAALAAAYRARLVRLRYRGGVLDGYASRLHYFSEWMSDAERKGILSLAADLPGTVRDERPLTFMSTHPEAYRQLAEDAGMVERIRQIEAGLVTPRPYVPEAGIEGAAGTDAARTIRNGDIIAAKSTLDGLDVAHTGIALWQGGALHLLHAPLVGDSVEVSALPLGERIRGFRAQDGILVARPQEAW